MAVVLPIVIVAGLCSPGVSREYYIWERKAPGCPLIAGPAPPVQKGMPTRCRITPIVPGHMFAGWITFSAQREGDTTIVQAQAQALMRSNDPLYEIAMTMGGHRKEDKFWAATLTALGGRLGLPDPQVEARSIGVDAGRQWRHSRNVWHNSMVRSVLQTVAAPVTGLGRLVRGMKSRIDG